MTVQRFRTRVVEIEAVQFTGDNERELNEWTEGKFRLRSIVGITKALLEAGEENIHFEQYGEVFDYLHDTWIRVTPGQWIVRGAKGEFYPCDDETFHWKYEELYHVGCGNLHPQADIYHPDGHWVTEEERLRQ